LKPLFYLPSFLCLLRLRLLCTSTRTNRCANFFHWAVGINAFLTLIKVTKYAKQYWIRIWLVNRTITKAGKDIVAFMVIFCIIVIACAQAFTMLFAKDIYQLRSIGVSM
jgi:hypothetical protein